MESQLILTALPHAGLCNRLRCLASAARIAQMTGRRFQLCWRVWPECGAGFNELFENDLPQVSWEWVVEHPPDRLYRDAIGDEGRSVTLLENSLRRNDVEPHIGIESCGFVAFQDEVVSNWAQEQPQAFQDEMKAWHQALRPVEQVRQKVDEIVRQFPARVIGLHIRRTDHRQAKAHSPLAHFTERIEAAIREDATSCFFLATDSYATQESLLSRFGSWQRGGHLLVLHKPYQQYLTDSSFPARDHVTGMRDALADLLLLARTTHVIGSYGSTFTWAAGLLGTTWEH